MLVSLFAFAPLAHAQDSFVSRGAANSAVGDFDGDGDGDVVYGDGVAGATSSCPAGYGAVVVHYGADPTQPVSLARGSGLNGQATCGATLGAAVAAGDVDGDGYDDLVVGLPGLSYGEVQVVYGSRTGLSSRQTTLRGPSADGQGARFGAALAAGDFDCDGYEDLAVGAPDADAGTVLDAGSLHVFSGGSRGVATSGVRSLQSASGDAVEAGDAFGGALAAGDLDGEAGTCGCDDLVVAAPGEDDGGVGDAGLVHVLFGGSRGVGSGGRDVVQPGEVLGSQRDQRLGERVAVGDVDGDGVSDLVLPIASEDAVAWLPGSPGGLGAAVVGPDEVDVDETCAMAVEAKVEIIIHSITFGPTDCEPCCGPGDCCIGGSCEP